MQNFDLYGRLNQVAVDGITNAFTYSYLEGSHLQKKLAMPNGVTRTFGYEINRDLLISIVHSNATERLVQRDFTFDGLGRLSNRTLFRANETPVQPDAFGYNLRSELTNAVIGANAFAYNFDPIGNRLASTEFGTNTAYITSALNQYTSISNSVNSVPLCEINPEFDLDGNQTLLKTTTGIWHVTYNAENRPVLFSNVTTVVEMAYDFMGRRFEYKETVSGTLTRHERYLYRGYLQIVALDILNSAGIKHTIAWDPSEPTATRPLVLQVGSNAYFYSFDQVKNVTEIFNSTGAIAATYDYNPFGQLVASPGNVANPLTFSSEIHDSALGLQYYNYRHLNTLDGRWVNRDPTGERGGMNVFCMLDNRQISIVDKLGLYGYINLNPQNIPNQCNPSPSVFEHVAPWMGGAKGYLGQEDWLFKRFNHQINAAMKNAKMDIDTWVKKNCGSSPFNGHTMRSEIDAQLTEESLKGTGEKPQSYFEKYMLIGNASLVIQKPVTIKYLNEKTGAKCLCYSWETTISFMDTLGFQARDFSGFDDFRKNQIIEKIPLYPLLDFGIDVNIWYALNTFPTRNVTRAIFKVSGSGSCTKRN